MKAIWEGVVIAESNETIVIEGNHYFPPEAVNKAYLIESLHTTTCPWKGEASYFDIVTDAGMNKNAAWYYAAPKATAIETVGRDFSHYVAFWKGVEVTPS